MISGLEDVVAAETVLSDVDGQSGRLVIRGHFLDDLVCCGTYEDVLRWLWDGFFEDVPDTERLTRQLGLARQEVFGQLEAVDPRLLPSILTSTSSGHSLPGWTTATTSTPPYGWQPPQPYSRREYFDYNAAWPRSHLTRAQDKRPTCCACCTTKSPTSEHRSA